ncbi:MAG TPA: signal peptide peptidase SppA [bacterium]|jgi:protease-4|nr:signal peptide peptidase SppA [bacterium]
MKNQSTTPSQGQNKTFLYLLLGFAGFFILSFIFIVFFIHHAVSKSGGHSSFLSGSSEIDLIEIDGAIYQSDDIVRRIRRFKKSSDKALILRLNSPGGAVAPSQEIYSEILSARQDNKKIVVASMSSLAASGAYYIAAACDKIVANPGTLTGSIGVIAEFPDASGLLKKVGVDFQTIKSGKFKDTGSFSRPMNKEERAYLQETVDDVFHQFFDAVVDGRKQPLKEALAKRLKVKAGTINDLQIKNYILPYADGRAITGHKAFELGLVDKLGNYDDAVQLTATLAGIKGEPTVHADKPGKFDQLLDSILPFSLTSQLRQYSNSSLQLEYRAF